MLTLRSHPEIGVATHARDIDDDALTTARHAAPERRGALGRLRSRTATPTAPRRGEALKMGPQA
jgi:hypothetical protein